MKIDINLDRAGLFKYILFVLLCADSPLGIASGRGGTKELILQLVKGGAHLSFRGKDGLTPVHRAAIGCNQEAISTLLSLGASPNYRDAKVGYILIC